MSASKGSQTAAIVSAPATARDLIRKLVLYEEFVVTTTYRGVLYIQKGHTPSANVFYEIYNVNM